MRLKSKPKQYHLNKLRKNLSRFKHEEDGAMTLLALFMIMMIVLVGGIGVDLMHNEMERTKLQNTLDRAVLAAAHIDQGLDPESVVRDYFEKSNQTKYLKSVEVLEDAEKRRVTATAHKDVPTQFMRLMGVDTLGAPGRSQAEERFPLIEISLVMDISRTMEMGDKMSQMRTAGNAFTKAVLREDTADRVSLSVVPFSEHVALSPGMWDALDIKKDHDYSHCVELDRDMYSETRTTYTRTTYSGTPMGENDILGIMGTAFKQVPHFQWLDSHQNNFNSNPNCPNKNHQHIRPLQQDLGELTRGFNGVSGLGSRSIYRGMKWGVALLDPSASTMVESLIRAGEVDPAFSGRPAPYEADQMKENKTKKVVVLMSSGENKPSMRIADDKYDEPSELVHWSRNNLLYYLDQAPVHPDDHDTWYQQEEDSASGDLLLKDICKAAKDNDIVIYVVAFDIADDKYDEPVPGEDPYKTQDPLSYCASTPSHYHQVYGDQLVDHLFSIGSQITRLRLTN